MTGTVRLAAADGGGAAVATLPLSALYDRGQGPMVWRVEGGAKVSAVPVEVVSLGEVTATLRGPLADGDRVVAVGPQVLDPDSRVRVAGTRLSATLR
jgi:hypothetical protein